VAELTGPSLKGLAVFLLVLAFGVLLGFLLSAAWRGALQILAQGDRSGRAAPLASDVVVGTRVAAKDLVKLAWLADAPLFIDTEQVAAFYDAVVRPEAEEKKITLSLKDLESEKTTVGGEAKANISIDKWLTMVFPFLQASVEVKGQRSGERQRGREETRTIELQPINSPQRQIVQLALHYALQIPERIKIISNLSDVSWYDPAFIKPLPRGLIFIDFPSGTAFMPMAAELNNGDVILLYDEITKAATGGKTIPQPDEKSLSVAELDAAWVKYWKDLAENFNSLKAMQALEHQIANGKSRIRWIDYRVPLKDAGRPVHLHIVARGNYDTGVFAYNLVRRGARHGIRLVGTMKSAPDINVLALFDK
jgi:hypothetical protein